MITTQQKNQIVKFLEGLDALQTEKVLSYIKNVLHDQRSTVSYQLLRCQALQEIRQALEVDKQN
jgi:hypothetical protein